MAVKLHRCGYEWTSWRTSVLARREGAQGCGHRVRVAPEPWFGARSTMVEHTGEKRFPAIEFEDGSWYREESKDMAAAISAGRRRDARQDARDANRRRGAATLSSLAGL